MLCLAACFLLSQSEIVVSPTGSDAAPGTAQRPVATLEAARDLARAAHCHLIIVKGGEYRLTRSVRFDARDSGLKIQATPGARPQFVGGIEIPASSVKRCDDPAILDRIIDPAARGKVLWVDLKALGVGDLAKIEARGFPQPPRAAPSEVFSGREPLTLARWPNQGYAKVGKVIEPGNGEEDREKPPRKPVFEIADSRSKLWAKAEDAWVYGYWKYDWADESIHVDAIDPATGALTLSRPHVYGVASGSPFHAENLIEELDEPGEYWIDRASRKLYFIGAAGSLDLSMLAEPLVQIKGASHMTIRGLDFCVSRGDGVEIQDGEGVRIEGCRMFDLGGRGAVIAGGHDDGLQSCDVWNTGEGGVTLSGGNRASLEPGRNFVDNCDIHHYQRRSQTYRPAVLIAGVGNRVSHCAMHDAPHSAIIFSGNDHVIEFNEFYRTISATGDGGVVYTGRDWTARGTQIRFNYFHDNIGLSKWEPAIYVDDLGSGITARGNLIVRCHWGFLIGGGRDNILEDNTLIDCRLAFDCDARGLGWGKTMLPTLTERLNSVPYKTEPWSSRYPALVSILDHEPLAPSGNVLRGNLLIRSGKVLQQMEAPFKNTASIEGNVETETAPPGGRTEPPRGCGLRVDALRSSLKGRPN